MKEQLAALSVTLKLSHLTISLGPLDAGTEKKQEEENKGEGKRRVCVNDGVGRNKKEWWLSVGIVIHERVEGKMECMHVLKCTCIKGSFVQSLTKFNNKM